jgi:hypothetical protein
MQKRAKSKEPSPGQAVAKPTTLATLLAALGGSQAITATRQRDLRSAVKRVAGLLGNEPAAITLDMDAISGSLRAVSPLAVGMTAKRFANIRSDFVAAVRASGMVPATAKAKKVLSPAWCELFKRLSGRRAHLGLSRFARYASANGIEPSAVNDEVIVAFIAAVRGESLHRKPNLLHRQVTLIWNEAARDPSLGLRPVTVASFRGPPKRVDWSLLPRHLQGGRRQQPVLGRWFRSLCRRCAVAGAIAADAPIAPRSDPCRRVGLGSERDKASHHPVARRSRHPQ